jgi:hypothetical protein
MEKVLHIMDHPLYHLSGAKWYDSRWAELLQRPASQIIFNSDRTVKALTPQGVTFFSVTYEIDSAISIYGPPNYALVVKIPNYTVKDPVYTLTPSGQAFLNLTTDNTFMTLWKYSMTGGQRDLRFEYASYVR